MKTFSTDQFDFKQNHFTAEASDLRLNVAPDLLRLKNPKTGGMVTFKRVQTCRDHENEITHWRYRTSNLELTIFND